MDWYVTRDGQQEGPYSPEEMVTIVKNGVLLSTDLIWRTGMDAWLPASEAPRFFPPPSVNANVAGGPPHIPSVAPSANSVLRPAPTRSLFGDFLYYTMWSLLWGALSGLLTPVYDTTNGFWPVKTWQVMSGIGLGFVFAILFTIAQNALNAGRHKAGSWALAIGIWLTLKFAVATMLAH